MVNFPKPSLVWVPPQFLQKQELVSGRQEFPGKNIPVSSTVDNSIGKCDNVIIDRMKTVAVMAFQELVDGRFLLSNCCREFPK